MAFHIFGFDFGSQPRQALFVASKATKVLWSSWCDAVVANQDSDDQWIIEYLGHGLSATQKAALCRNQDLKNALSTTSSKINFFGNAMHEGLRGFIISTTGVSDQARRIVLFNDRTQDDEPGVEQHSLDSSDYSISDIKTLSGGDILLGIQSGGVGEGTVVSVEGYEDVLSCVRSTPHVMSAQLPLAYFLPTQWCTNATTSTALDANGRVHTWTRDPRYPKCLGREYEGSSMFEPVPYLSETVVTRIASGGYLTAGIGSDGELFLWGQACPGSSGGLSILEELGEGHSKQDTCLVLDGDQDEYVKCLAAKINGRDALIYDVTIGHGHILVAAKLPESESDDGFVVFAAGDNSRNQLGLGTDHKSAKTFQEVLALRGEKVTAMSAAGWSSLIMTLEL